MILTYLAEPKYGGWVTFTAHLALAFRSLNENVSIYKHGKRSTVLKPFSHGLYYSSETLSDLLYSAKKTIITAVDKHNLEPAEQLLMNGASLVIHDPNEFHPKLFNILKSKKKPVITIRKTVKDALKKHGIESEVIPHPFISLYKGPKNKIFNACSYSRIDFDKHTEIIVQANKNLDYKNAIKIYGACNRMYSFLILNKEDPNWEKNYYGTFPLNPECAEKLAANHKYVVDLSVIKNDGGGTQYTFLEAWSQRAHLIINKKWIIPGHLLQDGVNCSAVGDAEELQKLLKQEPSEFIIENGTNILKNHSSEKVIEKIKAIN